jgi:hypothetical protein
VGMCAGRTICAVLAGVVVLAACSPSRSSGAAPTTSPSENGDVFCALYRRDAGDGQLRNWDLNDNGKTASYADTLRALDAAAPSSLRRDVDPILTYYASANPQLSPADDQTDLAAGARVLAFVHETCGIDTSAPPPGDATPTMP